jgi:hypothetical protein
VCEHAQPDTMQPEFIEYDPQRRLHGRRAADATSSRPSLPTHGLRDLDGLGF